MQYEAQDEGFTVIFMLIFVMFIFAGGMYYSDWFKINAATIGLEKQM